MLVFLPLEGISENEIMGAVASAHALSDGPPHSGIQIERFRKLQQIILVVDGLRSTSGRLGIFTVWTRGLDTFITFSFSARLFPV